MDENNLLEMMEFHNNLAPLDKIFTYTFEELATSLVAVGFQIEQVFI